MKFFLASLIIGLNGLSLNSQTLTAANFSPAIGEVFMYSAKGGTVTPLPGAGGAGKLWDYSAIKPSQEWDYYGISKNDKITSFPTANYVILKSFWGSPNDTTYREVTSNGIYNIGTHNQGTTYIYPQPQIVMPFPMMLGKSVVHTYTENNMTTTITLTADATGSLVTCYNTYTNVIRVHRSFVQFAGFYMHEERYSYYVPGVHSEVFALRAFDNTAAAPSNFMSIIYQDPLVFSGINSHSLQADPYKLYPVPLTDKLTIENGNDPSGTFDLAILNSVGVLVKSETKSAGLSKLEIDLSRFPAGIYQIRITKEGQVRGYRKIVKL